MLIRILRSGAVLILVLLHSTGSIQAQTLPSKSYDLALSKGVHALNSGRHEEARRAFEMALAEKPGDLEATYYLGVARRLLGQYKEAWEALTAAEALDSAFEPVHLDRGVVAYHLDRYDEAARELLRAETIEKDSAARQALAQYYLGLTFQKQERFREAATRFLRAVALAPDLAVNAHYFAGVAFYRQGVFDEATDAFEEVIRRDPASPMADSSRKFLEEMKRAGPKAKRWSLAVTAGAQYDSNVILLPEDAPLPSGISDESDLRWVGMLQGALRLFESQRFSGLADYRYYQSGHQDLDLFDVQSHDAGLTIIHQPSPRPYRFEFGYRFSDAFVDGENYLRIHTGRWAMGVQRNPARLTRLEYRYQNKDFFEPDSFPGNDDRSGINHAVGISRYRFFSDQKGNLHLRYTYDRESAKEDDWDYQGHFLNLGIKLPAETLGGWIGLALEAEGGVRLYENPNSLSTDTPKEEREDTIQIYTATVSRSLTRWLSATVQYLYNINASNIEAFDYDRQITSLSVTATF